MEIKEKEITEIKKGRVFVFNFLLLEMLKTCTKVWRII